jgi:hypothetical protein
MSLSLKKDVNAKGLQPEILLAILIAEGVYAKYGRELVITSLLDGQHMHNSLHYKGLAVDLRIHHLDKKEISYIVAYLKTRLGSQYDVVLETTHIHIEFDPK